jgi:NAD(P)H dehydrogenase (quinone)
MQILVIVGHADPRSFTHALARSYVQGARAAGAQVEQLELAALQFDLVLRTNRAGEQPLEPDLVHAQQAITRADHVVWFFPTWWAGPPALVKGFVDRVFLPGFAYRYEPGRALQHKLLAGRSARLVTSMDAPWWWYALFYFRALHAAFLAATLRFVGFGPLRTTTVYGLRAASAARRLRVLAGVERAGATDARGAVRLASNTRASTSS